MEKKETKKKIVKEEISVVQGKCTGFINEFKSFILRGNVMNLAVGVLIGASFQGLVTSLTDNIISPILGSFSKVDFSEFALNIGNLHLSYGAFITDVINFIIMAFVIFLLVKMFAQLENIGKKKEVVESDTVKEKKSDEVILLEEIRDLLKNNKK